MGCLKMRSTGSKKEIGERERERKVRVWKELSTSGAPFARAAD